MKEGNFTLILACKFLELIKPKHDTVPIDTVFKNLMFCGLMSLTFYKVGTS